MNELIEKLTSQLGIDSSVATKIAGQAMAMIKDKVSPEIFSQISAAVPGLSNAAESAEKAATSSSGGMLGALSGVASKFLGNDAGEVMELGATLKSAGLEADQMGGFANTVIEFLKEKVGNDVIDQVLSKVPMLKSLLG